MSLFYYEEDNQLTSWWELNINTKSSWGLLKKRVESVDLSFLKLETERKKSGETVYVGVEYCEPITLVIRESISFSTYDFFDQWFDKFYDKKNKVFRTFRNEIDYDNELLDITLTYYKGPLLNLAMSIANIDIGVDQMKPSMAFRMLSCKIIGLSDINATYDSGEALKYTITILPEETFAQKL